MPKIHRNQLERYPLVRTILSNYQNLDDAGNAVLSIFNDMGTRIEAMSEIPDEKFEDLFDELEKDSQTKEIIQKINDAFNGFEIDDENEEDPGSDKDIEEKDPIKDSIVNSSWFQKAIDIKLIEETDNGYKWLGTKGELTLFAELLSERLNIKSKWKTFEELFGEKRLASAKDRVTGNYGSGTFGKREKEVKEIFGVR